MRIARLDNNLMIGLEAEERCGVIKDIKTSVDGHSSAGDIGVEIYLVMHIQLLSLMMKSYRDGLYEENGYKKNSFYVLSMG
jgi:hypothetical protein